MNDRILLVEDEPADAALLNRALREVDLSVPVDVVRNGRSALDFLFAIGEFTERRTSPLPALVILDLKLPKIGGLEVLAQLRASESLNHLPVIVLTSSAQLEDIERTNQLGIEAYLVKPTNPAEYRNIAVEIRRHWQLQT